MGSPDFYKRFSSINKLVVQAGGRGVIIRECFLCMLLGLSHRRHQLDEYRPSHKAFLHVINCKIRIN